MRQLQEPKYRCKNPKKWKLHTGHGWEILWNDWSTLDVQ